MESLAPKNFTVLEQLDKLVPSKRRFVGTHEGITTNTVAKGLITKPQSVKGYHWVYAQGHIYPPLS